MTPSDDVEIRTLALADAGAVPNNPGLPVVHMLGVFDASSGPDDIRAVLEANAWAGTWRYTVFDFHHYHPNAHEALVVASGWADLILGGPEGETVRVQVGDVVVLPAGTGHCRANAAPDFSVCGAYPRGQEDYETVRAEAPRPDYVDDRIARVPLPETDPVYGINGPLLKLWGAIDA